MSPRSSLPRRRHRARAPASAGPWALGVALAAAGGCQAIESLRAALHAPDQPSASAPALGPDRAALHVEVSPPVGLTILLDGRPVAHSSPWHSPPVAAGPHLLEVRAMSHLPVSLAIDLPGDRTTVLPVSLRPRPNEAPQVVVPPPPAGAPSNHAAPRSQALGPPLPAGSAPVELVLTCRPAAVVLVDGAASAATAATLARQQGTLRVGVMELSYTIDGERRLTLTVPDDQGSWSQDLAPVHAEHRLVVGTSPTRLRREGLDGTDQSVVVRRRD